MALAANLLPFGLRDVKVTPVNNDGTYGTFVDLPASQTFSFSENEDYEQLRGDDVVQAERGNGPLVDWELGQGGISLAALAVIAGGTVTETGVSPNVVRTWRKLGTDARPYFRVDGQAINDNGGDTHVVVYRCKATGDVGGEFSDGSFEVTECSGTGYPMAAGSHAGRLWDIVGHETASGIIQPA